MFWNLCIFSVNVEITDDNLTISDMVGLFPVVTETH